MFSEVREVVAQVGETCWRSPIRREFPISCTNWFAFDTAHLHVSLRVFHVAPVAIPCFDFLLPLQIFHKDRRAWIVVEEHLPPKRFVFLCMLHVER